MGYKEIFTYIDGNMSLEETVERIKKNTRVYAKKQMTWFQRDKGIQWFHPNQENEILAFVHHALHDAQTSHNS